MRRLLASIALVGACLAASPAHADEPLPPPASIQTTTTDAPPGYERVEQRRIGPIVGGAVTLGTLYLISALAAVGTDLSGGVVDGKPLYIPVAGPFLEIAKTPYANAKVVCAIDGVGQTAALALLVYGLVSKKTVLVRKDVAVAPILTGSSAGAGIYGTF